MSQPAPAENSVQLRRLDAFHLKIRLKKPVQHASYRRTENDTLVVRCELSDGSVGWGEGLPRHYVTGETIESAFQQLRSSCWDDVTKCDFQDTNAVVRAMSQWTPASVQGESFDSSKSGFGNSVRCAVELACLDAACQTAKLNFSELIGRLAKPLGIAQSRATVRYSGVITSSARRSSQIRSALKMRLFGFQDVKLKVGHPQIDDVRLARLVRRILGRKTELRVDANEAWNPSDARNRIHELLPFDIQSVEQPLPDDQRDQLASLRHQMTVPLMLDESLCSVADAEAAIQQETCDAFNVRISKCGGVLNCLQIMSLAVKHGLILQLGCLVGETGILTAAGRHLACSVGPIRWCEGSYDRFVVKDRLTVQDLTFGYGGRAKQLSGYGLGIQVHEDQLAERTSEKFSLVKR